MFYFTKARISRGVEGLVTSQYEFWTDASFVLISILMKRRELNLGFKTEIVSLPQRNVKIKSYDFRVERTWT